MIRDWVRLNARQIIDAAINNACDVIVLESLRGFLPPGYDNVGYQARQKKARLAMFSYGLIRRKVAEKAVERGMRLVVVPYHCSSQFCSACGCRQQNIGRLKKNKQQRLFHCECASRKEGCTCATRMNSDSNAARVLARVFWGEIDLPPLE
jgi:transposase